MQIVTDSGKTSVVKVPGSKSYSHRHLLAAALSKGVCTIEDCLLSEDTRLTINTLRKMGITISEQGNRIEVQGGNGVFSPCKESLFLGNSGTTMRFVCALASLGSGTYTITGTERMQERPIQDLLDGLVQLGVPARSLTDNGCPPVEIEGGVVKGGTVELRCDRSSQFLSAMLLLAPCTEGGIEIHVSQGPVSKPYVDMTLAVMESYGITVEQDGYTFFKVNGLQPYLSGRHTIEPDISQAGYFWALAAVSGKSIKVMQTALGTRQGDIRILQLLEAMGCKVVEENDGVRVIGGELTAIEADMSDMPDMVPTLAVVSAFARGRTVINNVAHLRIKESDRLTAVVNELNKMGIGASCVDDGLVVNGGRPHGAVIETYNDHRLAMSFAVAGMVVPGVDILNPGCVAKSFPDFWEVLYSIGKKYVKHLR